MIEVLDGGALRFVRPDGRAFDRPAPDPGRLPSDWRQLEAAHRDRGLRIDQHTAVTLWRGERIDHGLAIEVLLQHARRGSCRPSGKPPPR